MSQVIKMLDYNKNYPKLFNIEKDLIKSILKDNVVNIYHIGSTSIPFIKSKPIIDIMVSVKDLNKVDEIKNEFIKVGYEYLGEFGIKNRRYLRKDGDNRTHQIHIFSYLDEYNLTRHLAFKEYLLTHKDVAKEYEELKVKLASLYPNDIEKYCDGKDEFVKSVEERALEWYKKNKELFIKKEKIFKI